MTRPWRDDDAPEPWPQLPEEQRRLDDEASANWAAARTELKACPSVGNTSSVNTGDASNVQTHKQSE